MALTPSACLRSGAHGCIATAEKNLEALKGILERLPSNACLCFVGDGPSRPDLAKHFEGLPVYFTVSPAILLGAGLQKHPCVKCADPIRSMGSCLCMPSFGVPHMNV